MLNMLSGIFGEMFWPMCECNLLALYERYEKKTRTMQRSCSIKRGVLRNFEKFTGKHLR